MFNKSNEPKYLSYENTVYFAINLSSNTQPTPTPIPTPSSSPKPTPTPLVSSSPTQQPTLEPIQSATPTTVPIVLDGSNSMLGIITAAIVAVSIVGLAVYFTKFRKT